MIPRSELMTCELVRIRPSSLRMIPLPAPSKTPREVVAVVSMATTDGRTMARMPRMSRPPSASTIGVAGVRASGASSPSSRTATVPTETTAATTAPATAPASAARHVRPLGGSGEAAGVVQAAGVPGAALAGGVSGAAHGEATWVAVSAVAGSSAPVVGETTGCCTVGASALSGRSRAGGLSQLAGRTQSGSPGRGRRGVGCCGCSGSTAPIFTPPAWDPTYRNLGVP